MKRNNIILEFIKRNKLAVISTITSSNLPESAVIEFCQTDNLEVIFDTLKTSRKYKNLQKNTNVALVIGWDDDITIQYEGIAEELQGKPLDDHKKIYFAKSSRAKKWESNPDISYFLVKPKWIRYSDLNKSPWEIFEVK